MRLTWTDFQLSGLLANISKVVKKADPRRRQVHAEQLILIVMNLFNFPKVMSLTDRRQIEQVGIPKYLKCIFFTRKYKDSMITIFFQLENTQSRKIQTCT